MSVKDRPESTDIKNKTPQPDKDKREFERFVVRLTVKLVDLQSGRENRAVTHDISAKGAGIVSRSQIDSNIPLEMWLEIPRSCQEPICLKGEVAWSKMVDWDTWRIGISFDEANFLGISRLLRLR